MKNNNFKKDIDFVKICFQESGKKSAYHWRHAQATADYLGKIAKKTKEIEPGLLRQLYLASLGHDLLEDTDVAKSEIEKKWGKPVFNLIKKLTNEKGDQNFAPYLKKLRTAPEEVLLIKFADIYSNVYNSAKNIKNFEKKWFKKFWLPLLDKYEKNLFFRKFQKYPRAANLMVQQNRSSINKLREMMG